MKNTLLVIILIVISITLLSNPKENNRKIIKKIEIKECASCSYNIVYENPDVKLYFDKSLLLRYIDSSEFKIQKKAKAIIDLLSKNKDTLYFYNPYWTMDLNPQKYGVTDDTDNGFDYKNSPADIIEKHKDLRTSEYFEKIIREYLIEGEFRIYDKKQNQFISQEAIYLTSWHNYSENDYSISSTDGEAYELSNGMKIIDKKIKMSLGNKIESILKDSLPSKDY